MARCSVSSDANHSVAATAISSATARAGSRSMTRPYDDRAAQDTRRPGPAPSGRRRQDTALSGHGAAAPGAQPDLAADHALVEAGELGDQRARRRVGLHAGHVERDAADD